MHGEFWNKSVFTYFVLGLGLPPQAGFSIIHYTIHISPLRQLVQQSVCWMEEAGLYVTEQKDETTWYFAFKSQKSLDYCLEVDPGFWRTRYWRSGEFFLRMGLGVAPFDWLYLEMWEGGKEIAEFNVDWEFNYPRLHLEPTTLIEAYEKMRAIFSSHRWRPESRQQNGISGMSE